MAEATTSAASEEKVTTTHITNLSLLCSNASRLICKPCIGNSDTRFQPLVASRSGKFLNRSGRTYQGCLQRGGKGVDLCMTVQISNSIEYTFY